MFGLLNVLEGLIDTTNREKDCSLWWLFFDNMWRGGGRASKKELQKGWNSKNIVIE